MELSFFASVGGLLIATASAVPQLDTIKRTHDTIQASHLKERQLLQELHEINQETKETVTKIGRIRKKIAATKNQIRRIQKQSSRIKVTIENQSLPLREAIAEMSKWTGRRMTQSLFQAKNAFVLLRTLKVMSRFLKMQQLALKQHQNQVSKLNLKQTQLKKRIKKLALSHRSITRTETQLNQRQKAKNRLISRIRKRRGIAQRRLKEMVLSLDSKKRDSLELGLFVLQPFSQKKGRLPSPVRGWVTHDYGFFEDEDYGSIHFRKGVFFNSPVSSLVRAISDGIVSYLGPLPGLGKTLIVDHGDHYYSVSCYLDPSSLRVGEVVEEGDVIGRVSSQPGSSGVYFELRHFGEPVDPNIWLKSVNKLVGDRHVRANIH